MRGSYWFVVISVLVLLLVLLLVLDCDRVTHWTRIFCGSDSAFASSSRSSSASSLGFGSDACVSIEVSRPNPGRKGFIHEMLSTVVAHRTKDQAQMTLDESCQLHTDRASESEARVALECEMPA